MHISFSCNIKRLILSAVFSGALCVGTVLCGGTLRFAILMSALFLLLSFVRVTLRGSFAETGLILASVVSAVITVMVCQEVNGRRGRPEGLWLILVGTACVLVLTAVLCFFQMLVSRKPTKGMILLSSGIWLLLAVINHYTYVLRGTAFSPTDFMSVGTAANVIGKYTLEFDTHMLYGLSVFVAQIAAFQCFRTEKLPNIHIRRTIAFAAAVLLGTGLFKELKVLQPYRWGDDGVYYNGFVLNYSIELRNSAFSRPDGYDGEEINALAENYAMKAEEQDVPEKKPHLIVIMNESFADLRVFGSRETNVPVTPYLDALTENTVRGFALSSVYGGTTPNSEYEFLTGNSMLFFKPNEIPFMQYVHNPIFTLERHLHGLGYESYFTHPADATNWRRNAVYPLLGFDNSVFGEGYENAWSLNGWVSDQAMYDNLIRHFESAKEGASCFLFGVTVQNHGPHSMPTEGIEQVFYTGLESGQAQSFLSCIHESDRAFSEFISYLRTVEEPVVVLMYGDHHPLEDDELIRFLHGGDLISLDEQMLKYEVPFIIWANYDIGESRIDLTSINFLSGILLKTAGLPLSPYQLFLEETRKTIPALNSRAYYSISEERFLEPDEAPDVEKRTLAVYERLEYNSVFDKKGRNSVFFPVEE